MSNNISTPIKPENADSKATRCLNALLDGAELNRKTLGVLGIAANNDSAHSLISILRNERFIPIESDRVSDETCNYFMKPEEILRYNNPILRNQQRMEMEKIVESKRIDRACVLFSKLLERLNEHPQLWQYALNLPVTLEKIVEAIHASLRKKGVN